MEKVVTLGEIMLRLSPPGYQRFGQAQSFDVCYGGAEANVADPLHNLAIRPYSFPNFRIIRSVMLQLDSYRKSE